MDIKEPEVLHIISLMSNTVSAFFSFHIDSKSIIKATISSTIILSNTLNSDTIHPLIIKWSSLSLPTLFTILSVNFN